MAPYVTPNRSIVRTSLLLAAANAFACGPTSEVDNSTRDDTGTGDTAPSETSASRGTPAESSAGPDSGSTSTGGRDGASTNDETDSSGASETDTATGNTDDPALETCAERCADLFAQSCLRDDVCATQCVDHDIEHADTAIGDAFQRCISDNPLCFESLAQCVLRHAYPPETLFTFAVDGEGFDVPDGTTVALWNEVGGMDQDFGVRTPLQKGTFWGEWYAVRDATSDNNRVYYYFDTNGNDTCDENVDIAGSLYAVFDGNFAQPTFRGHLTPEDSSGHTAQWVCQQVPESP